jgi:hypothetical protein
MGPTKVIVKDDSLYDVQTGKLIKAGLPTRAEQEVHATHHYLVLPVVDHAGRPWLWEGKPVYCLHGVQYETADGQPAHLARCPDCGGMGVRVEEVTIERDCIRCVQCGHEFDARLKMMES